MLEVAARLAVDAAARYWQRRRRWSASPPWTSSSPTSSPSRSRTWRPITRTGGRATSSSPIGPTALGDVVILTMATYPQREVMDSLQMGRVGGRAAHRLTSAAVRRRPAHLRRRRGARVEIVRPFEEVRLWADPDRLRARDGPHVPGPHQAVRAAPGHDAGRPRAGLGPEPHVPVRHLRRHLHRRAARPTRSTSGGASATTRGASATTAAARCGCGSRSSSTTGSSACGTGSSRTGLACTPTAAGRGDRRQRPGAGGRLRARHRVGRRPTARPAAYGEHGEGRRPARHGDVHARGRPAHHGRRRRHASTGPTSRSSEAASTR